MVNFFVVVGPCCTAFGILVPRPGTEPRPSAMKAWSPNRWTAREFLMANFLKNKGYQDFPGGAVVKNPPANAGDAGSIPGLGRSHMPCTTTTEPEF